MEIRDLNLQVIKDGFPELYERLINGVSYTRKGDFVGVDRMETLTTLPALCVETVGGELVRLNSAYDPANEARIWLDGQESISCASILLFGLGNGAFAKEVLMRKKTTSRLLIYEPSPALFFYALEHIDLRMFFSEPGVRVIIEGINDDMYSGVMEEMLTLENYESRVFLVAPQMERLFPESRQVFVERFLDGVGRMMSNKNTTRRFIHLSPYNQLHNLKYLAENTVVPKLAKVWEKDVPVVIVGAGPSLQDEVEILKQIKDKVFLFAVDSAMPFLLRNGVFPHAYICIEADKPMWFFEGKRTHTIPLFAKVDTTHKLLDMHTGVKIFGFDTGLPALVYDEYKVPASQYRYGGNGATSFFAVCKELGAKTVILVGQDMAYGPGEKTHVGLRNEEYVADSRFVYENNKGEKVQSRQDWHRFIKWYENAIPVCKFEHVVNTSMNGVKLPGTEIMSLSEAVDKYGREHSDVLELMQKAERTFSVSRPFDLKGFYQMCGREVKRLKAIVKDNPHAAGRKELHIYKLLELYEIADMQDDFEKSQQEGIEKIEEYIEKCKQEVE